jgi:hypothetical protein
MYCLQRARQDTSGLGLTGNSGSVQCPPNETRHPGSPRDLSRLVSSRLGRPSALPRIVQQPSTPEYAAAAVVHLDQRAAYRRGEIKWLAGPSDI